MADLVFDSARFVRHQSPSATFPHGTATTQTTPGPRMHERATVAAIAIAIAAAATRFLTDAIERWTTLMIKIPSRIWDTKAADGDERGKAIAVGMACQIVAILLLLIHVANEIIVDTRLVCVLQL